MSRLPGWVRFDWLNGLIYREVRAQTAPLKLHIAAIEQHLTDMEAAITNMGERLNERREL